MEQNMSKIGEGANYPGVGCWLLRECVLSSRHGLLVSWLV